MPTITANVCSISWIEQTLMSGFRSMPYNIFSGEAWLNQLCYGMSHTANPTPPTTFDGATYKSGEALQRHYRSLVSFSIELEIAAGGAFVRVRKAPNSDVVLDPGYTPPFDSGWELLKGKFGSSLLSDDPTITSRMDSEARTFSPGEKSSLSTVVLPAETWQTQGVRPLGCTSIGVRPGEIVLAHSLIKFRASVLACGRHSPARMDSCSSLAVRPEDYGDRDYNSQRL
jgi:hypothetical protein